MDNIDVTLAYLFRICVSGLVVLYVVLAGSAIHPLSQLSSTQNTALVGAISASLFMSVSIAFEKKLLLISDGLLTGGILSLSYTVLRSYVQNDSQFTFYIVTIGLVTAIATGYLKFLRHQSWFKVKSS